MSRPITATHTFGSVVATDLMSNLDTQLAIPIGGVNDSSNGFVNTAADTGVANGYVCSVTPAPSSYTNGFTVVLIPANTNTAASVINVNSLGNVAINRSDGSALVGGEITAGQAVVLTYYGTTFRIVGGDPTPTITSVRLRSYNALAYGNCNFEVDQRNVHTSVANFPGYTFICDRWMYQKNGTMQCTAWSQANQNVPSPGTSFLITSSILTLALTTQETTLAAGDFLGLLTQVEGPSMRELYNDVHSLSLLVRCTAPLKFGVILRDSSSTRALGKLCTIATANAWTLISLPNLPIWAPGGVWTVSPGSIGYQLMISLGSGTTGTIAANDTWQTTGVTITGVVGQDNFCALPLNTSFYCALVQHEPGAQCTQLMDLPFSQNLHECLRYFDKSYDYAVKPNTPSGAGANLNLVVQPNQQPLVPVMFKRRMAKVPTIISYSVTGGAGYVRDVTAPMDRAVSSYAGVGEAGYSGAGIATVNAGVAQYQWHYTADTGW